MGDMADDAIMWAENEGAEEDDGGYGWCPHVEDYGYCMGSSCRPIESDDIEILDDEPVGLFQEPGVTPSVTREMLAHLFDVPAEFIGDAKPAPSPGTGFIVSMDPSQSDAMPVRFFKADGKPARLDWESIRALYPGYEKFVSEWTGFNPRNVPQKINNPKEKYTMDMAGIAKLRAEAEAAMRKLAEMVSVVERFGGEPADGTVIKFEHEFDEAGRTGQTVYTYVAIRKGGLWYLSGKPFGAAGTKWSTLLEFIGEGRAWVAEAWREAPVPGAVEVTDADTVAKVAEFLGSSSGRDINEVASEVIGMLKKD